MRRVALVLLLLVATPSDSAAQPRRVPVRVSVRGAGAIKVQIAAGTSAPCDASTNVMLFDGDLRAGAAVELSSPGWTVCVRHTYGAFRQVGWSSPVMVSPRCLRWAGRRCAVSEPFVGVDLSTDAPYAAR